MVIKKQFIIIIIIITIIIIIIIYVLNLFWIRTQSAFVKFW